MTTRVYHWRRNPGSVTCDTQWTTGELRGETVVASACGKLVECQQAVGDPAEASCTDCAIVVTALANVPPVKPVEWFPHEAWCKERGCFGLPGALGYCMRHPPP